ncbi:MAG: hypothetical protein ACKVLL_14775 [Verrucomicrobiales bacterium]
MGTRRGSGGFLKIDLGGGIGNPAVAGACVPTYLEPGEELVWEVYAGSGYLLQSPPRILCLLWAQEQERALSCDGPADKSRRPRK